MEIIAEQKFLLMSPRKIRPVAKTIKRLSPARAVLTLPFMGNKAALVLSKVIKSAIAQAKERGTSESDLVFKEIQIGEGPRLKRGQPVSRGQWHPIKKRMSHIRVILATVEKPKNSTPEEVKKGEKKNGTKN
jgi:large subunit ribosomal protein L22